MENIFALIDEYTDVTHFDKLGIKSIQLSDSVFDDETIHDFIIENILPKNPLKLIIPASLGTIKTNFWGLRIGLHFRLTPGLGNLKRIPLIFVSDSSLDEILTIQKEKYGLICTTQGSILVNNSYEEINAALDHIQELPKNNYIDAFVDKILIPKPEENGKHSIANIWGVYQLAKITSHLDVLTSITKYLNKQKDLYFKYILAISDNSMEQLQNIKTQEIGIIKYSGNILFIDDEADKGWGEILKAIFVNANVEIVGRGDIELFNSYIDKAENKALETVNSLPKWDLILLDLRLDANEDIGQKANQMAHEYSGAKLLRKIINSNEGIQVIMFTASNKAWNMRELIEMGADGFYIKEAPEYSRDESFSLNNYLSFEKQTNDCFERKNLKNVFELNKNILAHLSLQDTLSQTKPINQKNRELIKTYLKLGFNAIQKFSPSKKEFSLYCFLEYYKIIEILGKSLIEDKDDKLMILGKTNVKINFVNLKPVLLSKIEPIKSGTFITSFKINDYTPVSDDSYYTNPTSSTRFAGLMLLRFGFTETDVAKFMQLNYLRNTLVAHPTNQTTNSISLNDIISLVTILKISFDHL